MKKFFIIMSLILLSCTYVFANNIQYGCNAHGDYVPVSVNGQQVQ